MITKRHFLFTAAGFSLMPVIARAQQPFAVVATFSILGDLVKQVGGERVAVKTLVGPNGDAHVYSPAPADGKFLVESRVIFTNGLGFEGWIDRLITSSGAKAAVVAASKGVTPLKTSVHGGGDHGHSHGTGIDPHAWQDVKNVRIYIANIRDALIAADESGKDIYARNATAYLAQLDDLDRDIRAAVERIPVDRRKAITSHDALGYFAKAYGLSLIAPKGVSTEAEVSAKDLARIVRQVKAEKIAAVFMENIQDRRIADQIARETGARIGGTLFSDALSPPDGPAPTYIAMMRNNLRQFTAALAPTS